MNKPLVSVIIPNYNHARFLDERIQSILNQTYQDYELIILDDCSSDNGASKEIIERYRSNPHVSHIVYNEFNSGSPFKQWHKGFELAEGKYIWIAESDDKCDNRLLEILVDACQKDDVVLSFCKSRVFYDTGEQRFHECQKDMDINFTMDGKRFISEYLLGRNTIVNASGVLLKKDNALAVEPYYLEFKASGDWMFWIELAERGKVSFVAQTLNYFRYHPFRTTDICIKTGVSYRENYKILNYLSENGYFKGFVKRLKYRQMLLYLSKKINGQTKMERMKFRINYYIYRSVLFLCMAMSSQKILWLHRRRGSC